VADDAGQQARIETTITVLPGPMHVGDLDGATTPGAKGTSILNVAVVVHGGDHRRVAGAAVTGQWSSGEAGRCTTDATGQCTVSAVLRGSATTSFTVQTLEHLLYVYRLPNHDPDGDSNGTIITFKKR